MSDSSNQTAMQRVAAAEVTSEIATDLVGSVEPIYAQAEQKRKDPKTKYKAPAQKVTKKAPAKKVAKTAPKKKAPAKSPKKKK
jgi:hypothetical protein